MKAAASSFVPLCLTDRVTAEGAFARSVLGVPGRRVPNPPPLYPLRHGCKRRLNREVHLCFKFTRTPCSGNL